MWNPFQKSQSDTDDRGAIQPELKNTINQIHGEIQNKKPIVNSDSIQSFIKENPKAVYIIDGKKGDSQSIICRNKEGGGKTCLKLQYEAVELFKQMQKFEYFCSLPDDVDATYFECRKY